MFTCFVWPIVWRPYCLAGSTSVEYYLLPEANAEYIQVLCFSA